MRFQLRLKIPRTQTWAEVQPSQCLRGSWKSIKLCWQCWWAQFRQILCCGCPCCGQGCSPAAAPAALRVSDPLHQRLPQAAANLCPSWEWAAHCYHCLSSKWSKLLEKNQVDFYFYFFFIHSLLLSLYFLSLKEENIMKANLSHFGGVKITLKSGCEEYFTFLPYKLLFHLFLIFKR